MTRLCLCFALALGACGDDDDDETMPTDAGRDSGRDTGTPDEDSGPPDEDSGPPDEDSGPPDEDAGPPGEITFRTDAPTAYTRVDRMGVPAVSTALVSSAMKNAYNDGNPTDDVSGTAPGRWAGEFIAALDGLHAAVGMTSAMTVNAQLMGAGLMPCVDGTACALQEVAPGAPVASFVIPDVLTINTMNPAGFPNGRGLSDPVMDIILALVLLDLETHGVTTFVDIPLNPAANDLAFLTAFPYEAAPHDP